MALSDKELKALNEKAHQIRKDIVQTVVWAGGGHIGGSLSQVEILVALYYKYLNVDPKRPDWADRDRVILSKGHGGVGYAPVLADKGYFKKELLKDFNHTGSPFGMHLDRLKVKGVDASTGSLGHGLSLSVGLALGARLKKKGWLTYCIMGDGEQHEGTVWEAAMAAHHFKLGNLKAIIDSNKYCIDGACEDIMGIEPLKDKWESFGWKAIEVDGHDFTKLCPAIDEAIAYKDGPCVIIAQTVKGKGVDYMENVAAWHYGGLDADKARKAVESIDRMYGGK
jgi:transketolase